MFPNYDSWPAGHGMDSERIFPGANTKCFLNPKIKLIRSMRNFCLKTFPIVSENELSHLNQDSSSETNTARVNHV